MKTLVMFLCSLGLIMSSHVAHAENVKIGPFILYTDTIEIIEPDILALLPQVRAIIEYNKNGDLINLKAIFIGCEKGYGKYMLISASERIIDKGYWVSSKGDKTINAYNELGWNICVRVM